MTTEGTTEDKKGLDEVTPSNPGEELITREEAASRLGVSVSEVRRRQENGEIKAVKKKGFKGALLFRLQDVLAMREKKARSRAEYTRDEASIVFAAFKEGLTSVDVVIQHKMPPEMVESLAVQYANLTGALHVPSEVVRSINKMPLDGPVPIQNHEDLVAVLTLLVEAKCYECNKRERHWCRACVEKAVRLAKRSGEENLDDPATPG